MRKLICALALLAVMSVPALAGDIPGSGKQPPPPPPPAPTSTTADTSTSLLLLLVTLIRP